MRKKYLQIAGFIVTFILVVGGVGYALVNGLSGREKIPTVVTKLAGEKVDISRWKTYANKKHGFQFRYPDVWVAQKGECSLCAEKVEFYSQELTLETNPFKRSMITPEVTVSYYSDENDADALARKVFPIFKEYKTIEEAVTGEIDIHEYGNELINGKNVNYILLGAESAWYYYFISSNKKKGTIIFSISYHVRLKSPELLSTIIF